MKKGRRLALLALTAIAILIVVVTVMYFTVPVDTTCIVRLRVTSPGEIFVDDRKVGSEVAEIEITGEEEYLIPLNGITVQDLSKAIVAMGRVVSMNLGMSYSHAGGDFPLSGATFEVLLSRPDGSFDSVVFFAVQVENANQAFAIPVRVKQGSSCAARTKGGSVGGGSAYLGKLYDRIVKRRTGTSIVVTQNLGVAGPDPQYDDLWWLDKRLKEQGTKKSEPSSAEKK